MEMMKAVRIHEYGGPEVLRYEDVPRPERRPGEVLIRVDAAGVNPFDWKIREGLIKIHTLPLILGWELSGVIEATDAGATGLRVGDEVYSAPAYASPGGAYAEYIAIPEAEAALKPKSIDHIHASAVPLVALTAWQALFEVANLAAGQSMLIQGAAGGVGRYAIQFAKWEGAKVIGVDSGEGLNLARELGADEIIDYKQEQFEDKVRDVDVVFDLIGGETQQRSWGVLKKGGILVSTVDISSPETAEERGVRAKPVFYHPDVDQLTRIADLIDEGQVKTFVETVMPLAEARHAHEIGQSGQAHGKIVLRVV